MIVTDILQVNRKIYMICHTDVLSSRMYFSNLVRKKGKHNFIMEI